MRRLPLFLALFACAHAAPPPTGPLAPVQLVETAPVETTLDHPDIPEAYQVWPQMIAEAKERIDLNEFYLSNEPNSRLEPIVQALEAAVKRGVKVRVLGEEKFYKTYPETLMRLNGAGAQVRRFDAKAIFGGGVLHAKYFVIDGKDSYLGSQNFDWRSLEHIQELGVHTAAPNVTQGLEDCFELDWARAGGAPEGPSLPALPPQPPGLVFAASPVDHLPDGVPWDLKLIIDRIDHAQKSVRVQLLTYKSEKGFRDLEDALVSAAARGVKVQLLLSHWTLRKWTLEPLRKLDPRIEVKILTIPEDKTGHIPFGRVAHAKYMIVDGVHGWVGTSNWEKDYFYLSRNVGVFYDEPRLESFFESAWTSAYAEPFDRNGRYTAPKTE